MWFRQWWLNIGIKMNSALNQRQRRLKARRTNNYAKK